MTNENKYSCDTQIKVNELEVANAYLYAACKELMEWIDNWEPNFVEDDEWAETKKRVNIALKKGKK